jgi:hypothetical protein
MFLWLTLVLVSTPCYIYPTYSTRLWTSCSHTLQHTTISKSGQYFNVTNNIATNSSSEDPCVVQDITPSSYTAVSEEHSAGGSAAGGGAAGGGAAGAHDTVHVLSSSSHKLVLFYFVNRLEDQTSPIVVSNSSDGLHWSAPIQITSPVIGERHFYPSAVQDRKYGWHVVYWRIPPGSAPSAESESDSHVIDEHADSIWYTYARPTQHTLTSGWTTPIRVASASRVGISWSPTIACDLDSNTIFVAWASNRRKHSDVLNRFVYIATSTIGLDSTHPAVFGEPKQVTNYTHVDTNENDDFPTLLSSTRESDRHNLYLVWTRCQFPLHHSMPEIGCMDFQHSTSNLRITVLDKRELVRQGQSQGQSQSQSRLSELDKFVIPESYALTDVTSGEATFASSFEPFDESRCESSTPYAGMLSWTSNGVNGAVGTFGQLQPHMDTIGFVSARESLGARGYFPRIGVYENAPSDAQLNQLCKLHPGETVSGIMESKATVVWVQPISSSGNTQQHDIGGRLVHFSNKFNVTCVTPDPYPDTNVSIVKILLIACGGLLVIMMIVNCMCKTKRNVHGDDGDGDGDGDGTGAIPEYLVEPGVNVDDDSGSDGDGGSDCNGDGDGAGKRLLHASHLTYDSV